MVGAGVSGLSSLPLLIEEHQASKNALKALKASGRFNDKEYREAKSALDAAYRTYVSRALQRATFAGGMASGNISLGAGMAGGGALQRMVTTRDTLKRFEGTRGSRRDEQDVKHLAGVMGSQATHNYAKQPGGRINAMYAAPHKHMSGLVSEKEYKKMLDEVADGKVHPKTLERGGVFIPRPTRR